MTPLKLDDLKEKTDQELATMARALFYNLNTVCAEMERRGIGIIADGRGIKMASAIEFEKTTKVKL